MAPLAGIEAPHVSSICTHSTPFPLLLWFKIVLSHWLWGLQRQFAAFFHQSNSIFAMSIFSVHKCIEYYPQTFDGHITAVSKTELFLRSILAPSFELHWLKNGKCFKSNLNTLLFCKSYTYDFRSFYNRLHSDISTKGEWMILCNFSGHPHNIYVSSLFPYKLHKLL